MNRKIEYTPAPCVCSRKIDITIQNGKIENVQFTGGCAGNTLGIAALVKGMSPQEAIDKLSGIDCKGKGTSCPDQLANALKEAM